MIRQYVLIESKSNDEIVIFLSLFFHHFNFTSPVDDFTVLYVKKGNKSKLNLLLMIWWSDHTKETTSIVINRKKIQDTFSRNSHKLNKRRTSYKQDENNFSIYSTNIYGYALMFFTT